MTKGTLYLMGLGVRGEGVLSLPPMTVFARTLRHPAMGEFLTTHPVEDLEEEIESCDFQESLGSLTLRFQEALSKGPMLYVTPGDISDDPHAEALGQHFRHEGYEVTEYRSSSLTSFITNAKGYENEGVRVLYPWSKDLLYPSRLTTIVLGVYGPAALRFVGAMLSGNDPAQPIEVLHGWTGPKIESLALERVKVSHQPIAFLMPPDEKRATGALEPLLRIVDRLRGPGGCPWDQEQTHWSLRRYAVEEAYEVCEAVEDQDMNKLCEELGDLLLQVVLHARLARESGHFDMSDVVNGICRKMVRRHPHVFGEASAGNSVEVIHKWTQIKRKEKSVQGSLMNDLPEHWPALMLAEKAQRLASEVGFDWERKEDVLEKVGEELRELEECWSLSEVSAEEEVGDILFSAVNLARFLRVEPEVALTKAVGKFAERFRHMEKEAVQIGKTLKDMSLEEMDRLWETAKAQTKGTRRGLS